MIYVLLKGRIGNQLFMYALARKISIETGQKIVFNDAAVIKKNWKNSLIEYNLKNVDYEHKDNIIVAFKYGIVKQYIMYKAYHYKVRKKNFREIEKLEEKIRNLYNKNGIIACQNGYKDYKLECNAKNIILDGYFQSESYFNSVRNDILKEIKVLDSDLKKYPNYEKIENSNSVCISIKVEHNVGSGLYDVCSIDYWKKAIEYIKTKVENPLFFVCSDDVDFVKQNLIDCDKYEVVTQSRQESVVNSLAVMAKCKHFIIGNTTFGWWAQYLSENQDKIVVAPSRWMNVDMPIDIYENFWHLIQV